MICRPLPPAVGASSPRSLRWLSGQRPAAPSRQARPAASSPSTWRRAAVTSFQRVPGNVAIQGPSAARSTALIHSGFNTQSVGSPSAADNRTSHRSPPDLGRDRDHGDLREHRKDVITSEDEHGPALVGPRNETSGYRRGRSWKIGVGPVFDRALRPAFDPRLPELALLLAGEPRFFHRLQHDAHALTVHLRYRALELDGPAANEPCLQGRHAIVVSIPG